MDYSNILKECPCDMCDGKGIVERYPHYGVIMPDKVTETCSQCKGQGFLYLLSHKYAYVKDSKF